jgi:hypothetical protein
VLTPLSAISIGALDSKITAAASSTRSVGDRMCPALAWKMKSAHRAATSAPATASPRAASASGSNPLRTRSSRAEFPGRAAGAQACPGPPPRPGRPRPAPASSTPAAPPRREPRETGWRARRVRRKRRPRREQSTRAKRRSQGSSPSRQPSGSRA